jgi:alpha-ketoglutarate-dependent taurine dioxygenase
MRLDMIEFGTIDPERVEKVASSLSGQLPVDPNEQDRLTSEFRLVPEWGDFVNQARDVLKRNSIALCRAFPVDLDAALVALCAEFGFVSRLGNGNGHRLLHDVISKPANSGPADMPEIAAAARPLASEGSAEAALHTDSTGYPTPHAIMALACRISDPNGRGQSRLAHITDIVREIAPDRVKLLQTMTFPFEASSLSPHRVLDAAMLHVQGERISVRYKRDAIVRDEADLTIRLRTDQRELLEMFTEVVDGVEGISVSLAEGDVLLIDNRCVLHGRTEFDPRSPRWLRRLKVHVAPDCEDLTSPPRIRW